MEQVNTTKKSKLPLIISIIVGSLAIAGGLSIFLGYFLTTKNYTLLKNNLDIYSELSKGNVIEDKNIIYSLKSDINYFKNIDNGYQIDISEVKDNNSKYLKGDYYIEVVYSIETEDEIGNDIYTKVNISTNNQSYSKTFESRANKVYQRDIYFDDSTSYIDISIANEDGKPFYEFSEINFKFYSYVR